jgi:hypothetical protein
MTDPSAALTGEERFWLISLIVVFTLDLLQFATRRDPLAIYQPPVFVLAFMSYYCVLGPIQRVINNDWIHITINFRSSLVHGLQGALVFYLALRCGYSLFSSFRPLHRFAPPFEAWQALKLGRAFCWVGIGLFTLSNGPRVLAYLNPFAVLDSPFFFSSGFQLGPLTNYANTAINLLIPGILLQFAVWVRTRQWLLPWLLWSLAALAIFTSLGFRWRIVTLVVPMVLLWFIARGRRPSIPVLGGVVLGLLALAGLIESTRGYGIGLTVDETTSLGLGGLLSTGLNESAVFLVSGGMIANTPGGQPFVAFQPLIAALLFPIPRALWANKNSFEYLSNSLADLFGSPVLATGQAILNFAEYYLMFGWPSLIVMGLVSGWLLRCLWNWFSPRCEETLAQVAYTSTCGLLYIWVSRGYLPQVMVTFAFGSLPLFWFYYRNARPRPETSQDPSSFQPVPPLAQ